MSVITLIKATNFKKIIAVEIAPAKGVQVLGGKNGAGKTSVLDAITVALVGKAAMPDSPVHGDAESGEITLKLDDGTEITRKIKPDGRGTLRVSLNGMAPDKPQAWLDKRFATIGFDPLEFTRQDGKKQADTLRKLVGIDVSKLDAERKQVFDERTQINRDATAAKGNLQLMPATVAGVPDDEVSIADIAAAQTAATELANRKAALVRAAEDAETRLKNNEDAIVALNTALVEIDADADVAASDAKFDREVADLERSTAGQIAELQRQIDTAKARLRERTAELDAKKEIDGAAIRTATAGKLTANRTKFDEHSNRISELSLTITNNRAAAEAITIPDSAELQAQLLGIEATNRNVRANKARKEVGARLLQIEAQADAKTARLKAIDGERQALIASAKFPVAGLGFSEDGAVTFGDYPLASASQAEQIRVSTAIAMAMSPDLRVAFVRDGSLLDDDSMAMLAELADANQFQVFIERVGSDDENAVIIECGKVAS